MYTPYTQKEQRKKIKNCAICKWTQRVRCKKNSKKTTEQSFIKKKIKSSVTPFKQSLIQHHTSWLNNWSSSTYVCTGMSRYITNIYHKLIKGRYACTKFVLRKLVDLARYVLLQTWAYIELWGQFVCVESA